MNEAFSQHTWASATSFVFKVLILARRREGVCTYLKFKVKCSVICIEVSTVRLEVELMIDSQVVAYCVGKRFIVVE